MTVNRVANVVSRNNFQSGVRDDNPVQIKLHGSGFDVSGKACLRRIQIAERNEAEHEQEGRGRVVTRREVK